jgi:hypothetical protein
VAVGVSLGLSGDGRVVRRADLQGMLCYRGVNDLDGVGLWVPQQAKCDHAPKGPVIVVLGLVGGKGRECVGAVGQIDNTC